MKKLLITIFIVALASICFAQKQNSINSIPAPGLPGGRLTLTSGTPVTTSDVTGATVLTYTPYIHNNITLWNGGTWQVLQFSETSISLGTLTSGRPYDVFAYINGGTLSMEFLAWTNASTRATSVTWQDGRLCKSSDKTRLLIGTFYTTSTTTTEDSQLNRDLINTYNKVDRVLFSDPGYLANNTGTTYTYTTAAWGAANGGTGATVNYLCNGLDPVYMSIKYTAQLSTTGGIFQAGVGDNTTSSTVAYFIVQVGQAGQFCGGECKRILTPAAGYRSVSILMYLTSGTATIYADSDDNSPLTYVEVKIQG